MAITATAKGNYTPAPAGTFQAVCVDVIDLGIVHSEKFNSSSHKIDVVFQINKINPDNNKRFLVRSRFTLSISPKANLRTFLEAWRGKVFAKSELDNGFDVEKLLGANGLVNIVHNGDWANIASIMPLPEGMPKIAAENYVRQTKDALPTHSGVAEMTSSNSEIPDVQLSAGDDEPPF